MYPFSHNYHFDPCYGFQLESLLTVEPPAEAEGFTAFWTARYEKTLGVDPKLEVLEDRRNHPSLDAQLVYFDSTDNFRIGGWLLTPKTGPVRRGVVIGHGYGGRDGPDYNFPVSETAFLFPCFRGLSLSRRLGVSENPAFHVLHDIDKPERYIIGGCVEDLWVAVTVMLQLFPQIEGHIGYQGTSFGGGIGAMALPWDSRIRRAALNIPSFGHQAMRLELPTTGSGDAVSRYQRKHGNVMETLKYYDAALAARHVSVPVHVAAALFDPVVAPPGQFAIYNALAGPKELFVAQAGHFDFSGREQQEKRLLDELQHFFEPL